MSSAEATTVQSIVEALVGVVGKENVQTDIETLKKYSCDTSLMPARMPDIVVRVMTRDEIMGVIKYANANRIPVVPRSSGTGTYGTGIPMEGGIILDMSGMKRIPRIDTRNRWALLEAGVTFGELNEELDKYMVMGAEVVHKTEAIAIPRSKVVKHLRKVKPFNNMYREEKETVPEKGLIFTKVTRHYIRRDGELVRINKN